MASCTGDGEGERGEVRRVAPRLQSHDQGHGGAEGGDLRERKADEDDPSLDDVNAEVRVDPGQHQAGQERQNEKRQNVHHSLRAFTPVQIPRWNKRGKRGIHTP